MSAPNLEPYLKLVRLRQPVGVFLLLWPCWWAIGLADPSALPTVLLVKFALGALCMRSAGCIVNDMADRDFDRQVERTRTRPLASGALGMKQALALLIVLLAVSFAIVASINLIAVALAAFSLLLVAAYPFMKRITWWPQAFLGLTFNWGALMGWAAVKGAVGWPAVLLYAGGVFWTLGYDTIYAHQDKADDLAAGVKSTALRLEPAKWWLCGFYALAVAAWATAGMVVGKTGIYFLGIMVVAVHFTWQVLKVSLDDPFSCLHIFRSNSVLGFIMFVCVCLK